LREPRRQVKKKGGEKIVYPKDLPRRGTVDILKFTKNVFMG
jgi:hypothetical protein